MKKCEETDKDEKQEARSLDHASRRPLSGESSLPRVETATVETLWENRHLEGLKTQERRLTGLSKMVDLFDSLKTETYVLENERSRRYGRISQVIAVLQNYLRIFTTTI